MSTEAISWVFRHSKSRRAARLVLLAIANNADDQGVAYWVSLRMLSKESGVSFRQINRALRELVENSEISVNANAGPMGTHIYVLPGFAQDFNRSDRMSGPLTRCDRQIQIQERGPKIAPRMTKKDQELWKEIHLGEGPKLQ